ncbi:MAG: TrmH family RNA methyltransferase [Bacteroidetes bacterium]|nr:MAG: TrmH family RNA methyltransferase [Bacteroidota bacterium]
MNRKLKVEELKRLSVDEFKKTAKNPVTVVLDNVRSAHNVGAVFRTADAFLIEKIYLCGITPCPPQKEIAKTALGATESVSWEYHKDTEECINMLLKENYYPVAIEQTSGSMMLDEYNITKEKLPVALVFGNEVFGVNQSVIDKCRETIEIPQMGTKHSLNISVSAGIVLWEFFKKLKS